MAKRGLLVEVRIAPVDDPQLVRVAPDRRRGGPERIFLWIGLAVCAAVTAFGLPYYLAPIAERVRHPLHVWLKPSGPVGQTAGIVTFAMFVFMWLYPLRKKLRRLAFTGSLGRWLDVHIACGLLIPFVGAVHAGWRFQGLIGLGYVAMLLVSASGVVGKYLYSRIPRSRSGVELGLEQAEARRRALLAEIARASGLDPDEIERVLSPGDARGFTGLARAVTDLLAGDVARWRAVRRLRHELRNLDPSSIREIVRLARREMALAQQLRMLAATHRVFRFWHVAHRPFAISAFVAVTIHVVVVVSLGVTWLW
jgi:hypothetical protein